MEGSTQAPIRHPIPWREDDFWDQLSLDDELRREIGRASCRERV